MTPRRVARAATDAGSATDTRVLLIGDADQQMPARYSRELSARLVKIGRWDVLQHLRAHDQIKRLIGKSQPPDVAGDAGDAPV